MLERCFFWFILYSIIGWVYESLLCSVSERKLINRGFLNGPYCPIYGFGAVLVILVLGRINNVFLLFVLGAVLTCSLEYMTSFLMEVLFHARWWDYSQRKFNINGRICLEGALIFGAFSTVLVKLIHPAMIRYTNLIPNFTFHLMSALFLIIFTTDNIITFGGFASFNARLREMTHFLEQAKLEFNEKFHDLSFNLADILPDNPAYAALLKNINKQQRRMLKAFPGLKSSRYEHALTNIKKHIEKMKQIRTKK